MTDKWAERWAEQRKMGIYRYVLVYGMLAWGFTTGIGWALFMQYVMPVFAEGPPDPVFLWKAALIGFPFGGILWGATNWYGNELRFKKEQGEKPNGVV